MKKPVTAVEIKDKPGNANQHKQQAILEKNKVSFMLLHNLYMLNVEKF